MLLEEAKAAEEEIERSDYLFIDGPFRNPPPEITIATEEFAENERIRKRLRDSGKVIAFVKRSRKSVLKEYYEKNFDRRDVSETILLLKSLSILRKEHPKGAIVIGPFRDKIEHVNRRYVSRSLMHKPVLIEYPGEFPERILSDEVRLDDMRANIPNALRLAHELSYISDDEAHQVFSAVYKTLRGLEERIYERSSLRSKPYGHVRRKDRAHEIRRRAI